LTSLIARRPTADRERCESLRRRTHAPAFVVEDDCPGVMTLKCGSISTRCSLVPR